MLRITQVPDGDTRVKCVLEGRLIGEWVALLADICTELSEERGTVSIDLAGVTYADHSGLDLLHELRERRVELAGINPLLQSLLEEKWS